MLGPQHNFAAVIAHHLIGIDAATVVQCRSINPYLPALRDDLAKVLGSAVGSTQFNPDTGRG